MLVFDGECDFCRAWAAWFRTRLPADVDVRPYQELPSVDPSQARDAVLWLEHERPTVSAAAAVSSALGRMGGVYPLAGRVIGSRPGLPLANAVYRWISRNRLRLTRFAPRRHT